MNPGADTIPSSTARLITAASVFGDTQRRPPAAATESTSTTDVHVPGSEASCESPGLRTQHTRKTEGPDRESASSTRAGLTRAHHRPVAERLLEQSDRVEGSRRVERHFDDAKARAHERLTKEEGTKMR